MQGRLTGTAVAHQALSQLLLLTGSGRIFLAASLGSICIVRFETPNFRCCPLGAFEEVPSLHADHRLDQPQVAEVGSETGCAFEVSSAAMHDPIPSILYTESGNRNKHIPRVGNACDQLTVNERLSKLQDRK